MKSGNDMSGKGFSNMICTLSQGIALKTRARDADYMRSTGIGKTVCGMHHLPPSMVASSLRVAMAIA